MTGRYSEHDHEHYERPRRRTRPRTKDRPSYDDAVGARVVTVDRGRFTLLLDGHRVMAMKSRPLGRKGVVVAALADPEPRPRLIDRALVAAYDAGMDPLLILTKSDLADPSELLAAYRPLGVDAVVTHRGGDLTEVRDRLAGRMTVLIGHSGVGKSTLVNALVPGADRAIGHVNAVTGRGRHTSTSAVMLELPEHEGRRGWIVDTPGIRSFGLAHVQPANLIKAFPDLEALTDGCPRGCTHGETEPECALDEAVAEGRTDAERVESYRRVLASRERAEGD